MKFHHPFTLQEASASCRHYLSENCHTYVDFVNRRCLRVAIYKDGCSLLPTFNVNPQNTLSRSGRGRLDTDGFALFAPQVQVTDKKETFSFGDITVTLHLDNLLFTYQKNGKVLFADRAPLAYNLENEFGSGVFHYVTREEDERIFGVGDKGGTLNKAGRAFRIETTDCMGYDAKESDPLYKHVPFYICENSVGAYGIFYDTSDTAYLDFGKEINNYYPPYKYFKSEDDCLVYYVFFGTKAEILQNFASLCGAPAFPPKWSFDYCASTMAYTDAPDAERQMYAFLEKLKESDLSCSGFYLSSGYTSIGDGRYVFHWNRDKFPSPERFIADFKQRGIRILPNIKPAFLTSHPLYDEMAARGLFIKNKNGTPFLTQFWDGLGSYLDFTNSDAFSFWKTQVKEQLLDFGIEATWNDNNEFDIKDVDALASGFESEVGACRLRPSLTYLMVLSSYEAQKEKYPHLRPFLSTRSGGVGTRRLAQTWSGDNRTAFCDLRYCHNIGLTMNMSALYFYGHDLGGFTGDMPSPELLLRWLQHGVFEPRFTVHSWNRDGSATMPWSYPEVLPSVQQLFEERKKLLPYLYNCAYRAVTNEVPLNAPLCLYYDDAPTECDSMLLGRDVLVSFVFDEGESTAKTYLPKADDWYLGGILYTGGQTVTLPLAYTDKVPYFVRSGCVLPTEENGKTVLTVYPLPHGTFESAYFDDDGLTDGYQNGACVLLKMKVACTADTVTVTYTNVGNLPFTPCIQLISSDKRKLIIHG